MEILINIITVSNQSEFVFYLPQVCSLISHSGSSGKRDELHDRHRRDFVNCFQCCNSDICNRHLCNNKRKYTKETEVSIKNRQSRDTGNER